MGEVKQQTLEAQKPRALGLVALSRPTVSAAECEAGGEEGSGVG